MPNPTQRATKLFVQTFGTKADNLYLAPGRVNLIGEHTDYNDGFVLACAINFHTVIAARRRDDNIFRATSEAYPDDIKEWCFGEEGCMDPQDTWANYLKGFTHAVAMAGVESQGMDIAIVSDVPLEAGLSSSAALEIAFGTAMNDLNQLQFSSLAIAQLAQRGETQFMGRLCGMMDQMVSALGEQDSALLIDCLDLDDEAVHIGDDLSLIIIDSSVQRRGLDDEIDLRQQQCQQAADFFGLDALRHLRLQQLNDAKDIMEPVLYRRARHVITENQRTQSAARALEQNNMPRLSQLMAESHASMKDDFDMSAPQIDTLVKIVQQVVGNQGGVRMTGRGLGGSVVVLTSHELSDAVVSAVEQQYPQQTGLEAKIYLCSASNGAKRINQPAS
ncbi:galactokinase [Shewanella gelidii]|nr:galactokinase [Shewanella gelidii]MCL1097629.1 galactokinase [Shewanella gelidii]